MDMLDRLLGHDAWTTGALLDAAAVLSDEQLDHEFEPRGHSTRALFDHVIRNMEAWSDLMTGAPIRARGGQSIQEFGGRLERAADDLARVAREVARREGWDETWIDPAEHPPIRRTYGGTIAHVITHSMHHRAQLLPMLRQLGLESLPEGDVLGWEAQLS